MILEGAGIAACLAVINALYDRDRRNFRKKWKRIMAGIGGKSENKLEQPFKPMKVIPTQYGYEIIVSIPEGRAYKQLETILPEIESGYGGYIACDWNRFKRCAEMKIATVDYDSNRRFSPVETNDSKGERDNCKLFIGETPFLEKVFADMREFPHILVAGTTGTGKSRCICIIITNLLYWHDDIEVYLLQVSDKKDLKKFAKYKQVKQFAQNLNTADVLVKKHLLAEMKRRNKLIDQYNLNNIDEYNAMFPEDPIPTIYIFIDEGASLMPGAEGIDPHRKIKSRISQNLNILQTQCRSANMFIIEGLQRPDRENLNPNSKNLFNIIVGFRSNNLASAKTLTDDGSTYNLPNREAIFMGTKQQTMKTPFIDDRLIAELLESKYEEEHEYIKLYANDEESPKEQEELPPSQDPEQEQKPKKKPNNKEKNKQKPPSQKGVIPNAKSKG